CRREPDTGEPHAAWRPVHDVERRHVRAGDEHSRNDNRNRNESSGATGSAVQLLVWTFLAPPSRGRGCVRPLEWGRPDEAYCDRKKTRAGLARPFFSQIESSGRRLFWRVQALLTTYDHADRAVSVTARPGLRTTAGSRSSHSVNRWRCEP